jgi:uncharacterized membrane protein
MTAAQIFPHLVPRPKYVLFGVIGLMMLIVLNRDSFLIHPQAPIWEHYQSFKWWLLPHGVTGALALFLGPLQFSDRFRQRLLPWHRVIGRIYVCGVAVSAPVGTYIEYIKYIHTIAPLRLLIATSGFGTLFLLTTGTGFFMAKHRNIQAHKKWMTRSYAVALVFLEGRCVDQISWLARMLDWPSRMLETHSISDLWMFMTFSVVAAELVLWCEKVLKKRSSLKMATRTRAVLHAISGPTQQSQPAHTRVST